MKKQESEYLAFFVPITFFVILLCYYCSALCSLFYATYGGFFDSLSYLDTLAQVMNTARDHGVPAALQTSLHSSTVALPWIEGTILGLAFGASRNIAIIIQAPWILLFALLSFTYFLNTAKQPAHLAALSSIVTVSFSGGCPEVC